MKATVEDGRPSGHDNNSRFICINNNDNSGGAGGETPVTSVPPEPPEVGCEDCFINNLDSIELPSLETILTSTSFGNLEGFCIFLSDPAILEEDKRLQLELLLLEANIDRTSQIDITDCLVGLGLIPSRG